MFLTTHYMEEAADADYVVILDHGQIAAEGTPLKLKDTYTKDYVTLYAVDENAGPGTESALYAGSGRLPGIGSESGGGGPAYPGKSGAVPGF